MDRGTSTTSLRDIRDRPGPDVYGAAHSNPPGPWCGVRRTAGASALRHEPAPHARPGTARFRAGKKRVRRHARDPAGAGDAFRARNPLDANAFPCGVVPPPRSNPDRFCLTMSRYISLCLALSHFASRFVSLGISLCLTLSRFISAFPAKKQACLSEIRSRHSRVFIICSIGGGREHGRQGGIARRVAEALIGVWLACGTL